MRVRPSVRGVPAHIVSVCARVAGVARHVMRMSAVARGRAGDAVRVAGEVGLGQRDGVRATSRTNSICITSADHK